ncbi:transcriptional regulator, partial [Escherichia sp. R-CC3]
NQEVLDVSGRQHTHDAPRTRIQDAIDVKLRA